MTAMGQPLSRADGRLKVTGAARYTADVPISGAVHAAIVHSTIARGRTVSIARSASSPPARMRTSSCCAPAGLINPILPWL